MISLFIVCILLSILLQRIEGLRCFKCMYISGVPTNKIPISSEYTLDPSCDFEKSPNITFLEECSGDYPPDYEMLCSTIQVKGKQDDVSNDVQVTLRSCIFITGEELRQCFPYSAGDIANISNLPDIIQHIVEKFDPETPGNLCLCGNDRCNQACKDNKCEGENEEQGSSSVNEPLKIVIVFLLITNMIRIFFNI